jgi:hypothetical protein
MEPSREPDLPSQPHVTASQHELAIFAAMSVAAPALLPMVLTRIAPPARHVSN